MMTQKTGALIFDETADRYDIRFDVKDVYKRQTYIIAPAAKLRNYGNTGIIKPDATTVSTAPIGSTTPESTPYKNAFPLLLSLIHI